MNWFQMKLLKIKRFKINATMWCSCGRTVDDIIEARDESEAIEKFFDKHILSYWRINSVEEINE